MKGFDTPLVNDLFHFCHLKGFKELNQGVFKFCHLVYTAHSYYPIVKPNLFVILYSAKADIKYLSPNLFAIGSD